MPRPSHETRSGTDWPCSGRGGALVLVANKTDLMSGSTEPWELGEAVLELVVGSIPQA